MANTGSKGQSGSEPFIAQSDRPKVGPDTPVAEMRVSDLMAILASGAASAQGAKPISSEVVLKPWWHDVKLHKWEKFEKFEHKHEKFEIDPIPKGFEPGPGPVEVGRDPVINQVMQQVAGLQAQVSQLSNQIEQMRSGGGR